MEKHTKKQPSRARTQTEQSTSWGSVADWYEGHLAGLDTYHAQVLLPNVLRLLELKRTHDVLDVPCGEGYFARQIATHAKSVTGVDISAELVGKAKRDTHPGLRYIVSPAHQLTEIKPNSIHRACTILGIQNIKEVPEMLEALARVMKQDGLLLIVMNHPAFRIPKGSTWGWDQHTHTQYRRLDRYMSESHETITMHPGKDATIATVSFHRPLQWYVKHLSKAGFVIDKLEEWVSHKRSDSGPRAKEENRTRNEFPLFLALRARKL